MGLDLELDMNLLWLTPLGAITFHGLYFLLKNYLVARACKAMNIRFEQKKASVEGKKSVANGSTNGVVVNGLTNGASINGGANGLMNGFTKDHNFAGVVDADTSHDTEALPPEGVVAEIAEKSVSILTSSTCATLSFMAVWQTAGDIMLIQSPILQPMAYWMLWYWVYDLYAMCNAFCIRRKLMEKSLVKRVVIFVKCKLPLILHHVVILFLATPMTMFYSLRGGKGDFIIACFSSHEIVNPFMHMSQIMRLLNKSHTIWFKINGVFLVLTFLLDRILLYPFMYLLYAWQYRVSLLTALGRMRYYCHIGTLFGLTLNTYWFVLVLKLVKRALAPQEKKTVEKAKID